MEKVVLKGKYLLKTSIVIEASRQQVWRLLEDFDNVYVWAPAVTHSSCMDASSPGVGHARLCRIKGIGSLEEVITHWVEGVGFIYQVTPIGPLGESVSRWRLKTLDRYRTEVQVELAYDLRFGYLGLIMHKFIMRKKLAASLEETLLAMKAHVEAETIAVQAEPELTL